jgi:hypothetical protein
MPVSYVIGAFKLVADKLEDEDAMDELLGYLKKLGSGKP